jgi:Tfp pilus assembly protein PilF
MTAIAGALAVMGCASVAPERPAGPFVVPSQTVRHGMDADAHYRTGRYFQGQLRFEQAIGAYRRVLAAQPGHVDALNALGVIYSLQQKPELAEQAFMLALQANPQAARVHNNLGYHLLQNGRNAEAIAAFERARELEPGNANTQANLAAARAKMGLPGETTVVVAATAVAAPMAAPAPLAPAAPVATPVPAQEMVRGRLEIANGNGTSGLARRVSGLVAMPGTAPARLTNHKPYGVQASRIQYVAGSQRQAQEINARLPSPLPLALVETLERDVRVRVLLGKDFPPSSLAGRISTWRNS